MQVALLTPNLFQKVMCKHHLNGWDERLLKRHLPRYKKLESGEASPSSNNEAHFVKVFNGSAVPKTQHEIAYTRYKAALLKDPNFNLGDEPSKDQTIAPSDTQEADHRETSIQELDTIVITASNEDETRTFAQRLADMYRSPMPSKNDLTSNALAWLNYLNESTLSKALEQWSAEEFNTLSNSFTKALDGSFAAEGLKSGADYVAPTLHRLIEAGHTLPEAFKRGRETLNNDTVIQELWGTTEALLSDMSSVVGLPLINISKEAAEEWLEWLKPLGIDEKRFADFFSYNTVELAGSAIPALALMFSWNSDDTRKFTELVGTLALTTAYAGNPFGLIISLVGLARSFQNAKRGNISTTDWLKSLGKGGVTSSIVLISMSLLGPTAWAAMISAIVIAKISTVHGFEINWAAFAKFAFEKMKSQKTANQS